jgi:hypothetical protein
VATDERRNERVLLASFTNTQQFSPWLDALEEAGAGLAGVYSAPLLAPRLAARLGVRGGRAFLVTAIGSACARASSRTGGCASPRLERTIDTAPQALALFVRSETHRLAQYLATLRALPRDGAPIQVLVVAPPGERRTFEQVLGSDARLTFRTVDADEAARAAGLKTLPQGAAAEAYYLISRRRNPRASSSPTAKTAGATRCGNCSAASSPRAQPCSRSARSPPERDGSRRWTCAGRRRIRRSRRDAPPTIISASPQPSR